MRRQAIEALARRFSTWDERVARRRSGLASALQALADREAAPDFREALLHAAWIVDIGNSIGYVGRLQHAAAIVAATDLAGFSHRQAALLAAVVREADKRKFDWRIYRPVLSNGDQVGLRRSGLVLALADEVERRLPREAGIPVAYHDSERAVIGLALPIPFGGRLASLVERFSQVFGLELRFEDEA